MNIDELPDPVECFEAAPKYVYEPEPLDDMYEQLMNAGALN